MTAETREWTQGVRVSSRPGCRCTRGPAVPTRPSRGRNAERATWGCWRSPGDAERDEWRACPPEQAGSGEVGRGGEGGIRERRRRAAGDPRAAGSINSRPGLTGAAVTGGVASPAARGEGGARGAAGWGRRTPVSWWRRQEAEGEESRRVRRAGAGRCFPAPGCVASVASAVGGVCGAVRAVVAAVGRSAVLSGPAVRSGSRGGPGRPPSASRRTPGQRRASAAARPVCGPEGKGKGHGDVEGEQVRARGRLRPAGASERAGGRGRARRPSPAVPSVASSRAPPPRACVVCSGGRGGAFRRLGR